MFSLLSSFALLSYFVFHRFFTVKMNKESTSSSNAATNNYASAVERYIKRAESLKQKAKAGLTRLVDQTIGDLEFDLDTREEELEDLLDEIDGENGALEDLDEVKYTMLTLTSFIEDISLDMEAIQDLSRVGLGDNGATEQRFFIKDIQDMDRSMPYKDVMEEYTQSYPKKNSSCSSSNDGHGQEKTSNTAVKSTSNSSCDNKCEKSISQ